MTVRETPVTPSVDDLGTKLFFRLVDQKKVPIDVTQASAIVAFVTRPKNPSPPVAVQEITLASSTDPEYPAEDGWAQYQTSITAPSWFDRPGTWLIRPRITIAGVGQWKACRASRLIVNA
jgi:hypothetical protein